jgi:hypothetical protein
VDNAEIESLRREVESALSGDGWRVELDSRHGLALEFSHPLTQTHRWSYGLDPNDSRDDALRKVWRAIDREREFADVRGGPIKTRRGRLLSGLRVAAGNYGWDQDVFREVVWTLRELQMIGLAEAEWLERVGPVPRPHGTPESKLV